MESPILADFYASSLRNGYDPLLTQSMVSMKRVVRYLQSPDGKVKKFVDDKDAEPLIKDGWRPVEGVPDPIDKADTLLTVDSNLAEKLGLSKGTYTTPQAFAAARGLSITQTFAPEAGDKIISFLSNSAVRGILIIVLLIIVFVGLLGWFPAGGMSTVGGPTGFAGALSVAYHLFLPCLTLTLGYIGEYVIIMRSSLLEVMGDDYIMTARAKGVPDRLVRRNHAVPNALLPTLTLVFYSFGFVLGGAVIVEAVFSWPGLGLLTYDAIGQQDYPVIQAVVMLYTGMFLVLNLLTDLGYALLDPRIRYGG